MNKILCLILLGLFSACSIGQKHPQSTYISAGNQQLHVQVITTGLLHPWAMDFLPNGRLLITEREGVLISLDATTGDYVRISGVPEVFSYGQASLFDVAVHPSFEQNRLIYLSYAHQTRDRTYTTRVARARLEGRKLLELTVLFEASPAFTTTAHFGGALQFNQQGELYVSIGDRRQRQLAQDKTAHMGKVLHINDDNTLVKEPSKNASIVSLGHRNPQGMTLDKHGKVWLAEHGPQGGDEVNLIKPEQNYGWPLITYGEEYGGGKIGEGTHKKGMTQPLYYYVPSIGTAGIDYYDDQAIPFWRDSLFVVGLKSRSLSRIQLKNSKVVFEERLLESLNLRLRDVKHGPNGRLYLLSEDGQLLRIGPFE